VLKQYLILLLENIINIFVPPHNNLYLWENVKELDSQNSRKWPPKMSNLGGRLRQVVSYESLDHISLKFCLIRI